MFVATRGTEWSSWMIKVKLANAADTGDLMDAPKYEETLGQN